MDATWLHVTPFSTGNKFSSLFTTFQSALIDIHKFDWPSTSSHYDPIEGGTKKQITSGLDRMIRWDGLRLASDKSESGANESANGSCVSTCHLAEGSVTLGFGGRVDVSTFCIDSFHFIFSNFRPTELNFAGESSVLVVVKRIEH